MGLSGPAMYFSIVLHQFWARRSKLQGEEMVESVTEHFYASMGVNRLRGYLTSFGGRAGLNMGILWYVMVYDDARS